MEITLLAVALVVLAAVLIGIGLAGLTERLPRNRLVGIRSASMRDDDERWRAGHRAASQLLLAAAGPPLLLALALFVTPPDEIADWFLIYAVVGVVTGGLIALAVKRAEAAAEELRR
jgi:uncharacterized membrane protein